MDVGEVSTPGNKEPRDSRPQISVSPQTQALDKNFRNAVGGLKRELVRCIFYLRVIYDRKAYRAFGYRHIAEYAAAAGGLTKEQCVAFLKIGSKLGDLPQMQMALSDGLISWRKAETIVKQADPQSEADLVEAAQRLSNNGLKNLVKARRKGQLPKPDGNLQSTAQGLGAGPNQSRPQAPPVLRPKAPAHPPIRPADDPCYLTYKLTPEQYSAWGSLTARLSGGTRAGTLIEALAAYLGGQDNPDGKETGGFLIIIQECPACGRARHQNSRGAFEVPAALLKTAHCDATIEGLDARRRQVIAPRLRRRILKKDGFRCQAEGCTNTLNLQLHHRIPISEGGKTVPDNLVTLCRRCHRQLHAEEEILREANRGP